MNLRADSARYSFAASHRLHSGHLTEAENLRVYGKCNNPYGHGHNYVVEVTVAGAPDPATGMIAHLGELDTFVASEVLEPFDHKYLNKDVAVFARTWCPPRKISASKFSSA